MLSITGRAVGALVALSCRRPSATIAVGVAFALAGAAMSLLFLSVETSKLHLLPTHQRYADVFRQYVADFGALDDVLVVVRGPSVKESAAFAEALARRLRAGPIPFERISYRVEPRAFEGRALLYMPLPQLERLHDA